MDITVPRCITVNAGCTGGHLQGIAIDKEHKYLYLSFTTCLLKTDLSGNIIGSVSGLTGHLGCIAYNQDDDKVYGSLEYKKDAIGQEILKNIGYDEEIDEGFYAVSFDVKRITRKNINAADDSIMNAVFLNDVFNDYSAPGHRYGCSGIDGITFAPGFDEDKEKRFLYVCYGIYGDPSRADNDYQVILKYDTKSLFSFAQPLNRRKMHKSGPKNPMAKYFVYTGNTRYGIQNLEYDNNLNICTAAVYKGEKADFPNYSMFFIDCNCLPASGKLYGINEIGEKLSLTNFKESSTEKIFGSHFPLGSTGIISLGDGLYYISEPFKRGNDYGGIIRLYMIDTVNLTFNPI